MPSSSTYTSEFYDNSDHSRGYYISAGSSAVPTYTWATTRPITTEQQIYEQKQQQQSTYQPSEGAQVSVSIPETSNGSPGPLTPIRHAPPPPEQEQQQLSTSTAATSITPTTSTYPTSTTPSTSTTYPYSQNGFKTDISAAEDLIPIQNHHPLHPHIHQKDQTPQHAHYQHGKMIYEIIISFFTQNE